MTTLRRVATGDLTSAELSAIRALCDAAWGGPDQMFDEDDWAHALGGVHMVVEEDGNILAHASVVPRTLHAGGLEVSTGYVEVVATWPAHQHRGHGTAVMREVNDHIDRSFELGALSTGVAAFYERLGWRLWTGPTSVLVDGDVRPTPDDDGGVMVRFTPSSPPLDPSQPISCDWRPGDVW
jgi:aminoglycoside 2'-N-acetyltransferase I